MKLEKLITIALEKFDFNKALLAKILGKRANQLANGEEPLVNLSIKDHQPVDIALVEIAEGKLIVEYLDN